MRSLASRLGFERSPHAIAALDGVRALAILLVLGRHAVRPFVDPSGSLFPMLGWDLSVPLLNGWMGVDLFFVLSGFLIAGSLARLEGLKGGRLDIRLYLAKRVLRIVPAYYAVLLVAAFGAVPYYDVVSDRLANRVAYHLIFFQDYLPSDIVVAFWSLGVEEKFYLTAPVMWFVVSRLRRRGFPGLGYVVVAAIVLLGPVLRFATHLATPQVPTYDEFFPLFRSPFHLALDPLYIGVLAALIFRDREGLGWTRSHGAGNALFWVGACIVGGLLFCGEMLAEPISVFDMTVQPFLLAVGSGCVVLALALGAGPAGWFSRPSLFWISKLSYSLYLVHLLAIPMSLKLIESLGPGSDPSAMARFGLFLVPYLTLSLLMALFLFYLVERPALNWKDRLSSRPSSQSQVGSQLD